MKMAGIPTCLHRSMEGRGTFLIDPQFGWMFRNRSPFGTLYSFELIDIFYLYQCIYPAEIDSPE
jgi:hypothetical protein